MKREELKALELSDDVVDKIMAMNGADIEKQKNTIATLTADRDDLQKRLETANSSLEGYDPEWKSKAEQAQAEAEAKMQKLQRSFAYREQVSGLQFSSSSAKRAFLADLEAKKLPVQEDKVLGFEEFLKSYKESDPEAFVPEKPVPTVTVPGQGRGPQSSAKEVLDEKYKNNPFFKPKGE